MSGHTPGPWEVGEPDRNGQAIVRGKYIEICTCWHHSVGSIEKEMHANARLIAAAPDGLAFAQAFLEWHEGPGRTDSPLVEQARAFIAKATGTP